MATSFPFLAIARHFDIPYGRVIRTAEAFGNPEIVFSPETSLEYNQMIGTLAYFAIAEALGEEARRRFEVEQQGR
jgi:hypothetical protein